MDLPLHLDLFVILLDVAAYLVECPLAVGDLLKIEVVFFHALLINLAFYYVVVNERAAMK